jgi:hypothetical protein
VVHERSASDRCDCRDEGHCGAATFWSAAAGRLARILTAQNGSGRKSGSTQVARAAAENNSGWDQ